MKLYRIIGDIFFYLNRFTKLHVSPSTISFSSSYDIFSAWRAMSKDLHELHAKYYKRLLQRDALHIGWEREDPIRCFWVLGEYPRRCQQMVSYDLLFFSYFCRFLGRSQGWPLKYISARDIPWTQKISSWFLCWLLILVIYTHITTAYFAHAYVYNCIYIYTLYIVYRCI